MGYKRKISSANVGETQAETARNAGVSAAAVSKARVKSKEGLENLESAVLRKETALADLRQTEAALATGDAISIAETEAAWAAVVGMVRAKLLGLPSKVAREVAAESNAAKCREIIRAELEEVLEDLSLTDVPIETSRASEPEGGSSTSDGPVEAAAQPHS